MSDAIRIFGTKQIEAKFKALPAKIGRKVMRKGLTDGARIVCMRARESVPVATGTLRKSIRVLGLKGAKAAGFRGKSVPLGKRVIASAPHAHLVERGTKKMAARPFLSNALEEKKSEVFDAIANAVREGIRGS